MRRFAALALVGALGCGHAVPRGLEYGRKGLALVRVPTNEIAKAHLEAAKSVVDRCRAELGTPSTPAQRMDCVEGYGFGVDAMARRDAAVRKFAEAYDAWVTSIETMTEAWPTVVEAIEATQKVAETP